MRLQADGPKRAASDPFLVTSDNWVCLNSPERHRIHQKLGVEAEVSSLSAPTAEWSGRTNDRNSASTVTNLKPCNTVVASSVTGFSSPSTPHQALEKTTAEAFSLGAGPAQKYAIQLNSKSNILASYLKISRALQREFFPCFDSKTQRHLNIATFLKKTTKQQKTPEIRGFERGLFRFSKNASLERLCTPIDVNNIVMACF